MKAALFLAGPIKRAADGCGAKGKPFLRRLCLIVVRDMASCAGGVFSFREGTLSDNKAQSESQVVPPTHDHFECA